MQVHNGIDNMALASRVAMEIEEWHPDAVFIDSGAGAGIIDRLRQLGYQPIEVPFGGRRPTSASTPTSAPDVVPHGRLDPGRRVHTQRCAAETGAGDPIYWFDKSERKVLESKDEIKKRLKSGAKPGPCRRPRPDLRVPRRQAHAAARGAGSVSQSGGRDPLDTV